MSTKELERKARQMRTHTIVFTDNYSRIAAVRALQGLTTKAIAAELGISESKVQYRISKAQRSEATRYRADYRYQRTPLAKVMLRASFQAANRHIEEEVAPKFIPLARAGTPRSAS